MSTYEPGTVATATVRGVPNVRVFRRHSSEVGCRDWAYSPDPERGLNYSCDSDASDVVTDIRPLVVLDLEDGDARMLPRLLRQLADREQSESDKPRRLLVTTDALRKVADQIEAQTKPPRIPEPGWGAIVEAGVKEHDERLLWTAIADDHWHCQNRGEYARRWSELVDPTLVRDVITGGAS